MAKLSKREQDILAQLQAKAEAPESPSGSRNLSVNIDLGDDKQVKRAIRLGLIDDPDADDTTTDDDDDDEDADETPRRKGYFS